MYHVRCHKLVPPFPCSCQHRRRRSKNPYASFDERPLQLLNLVLAPPFLCDRDAFRRGSASPPAPGSEGRSGQTCRHIVSEQFDRGPGLCS